ncbi:hypothetical protein [Shewanella algae]|uniref:hypothetical protein n=1 Tax=Shewanella algae TaxID=38313 RepID=UPI002359BE15|nr:hypothetical protein [Shewanella algae]MDC8855807.1 hypothetical protein [Shewanella algae]
MNVKLKAAIVSIFLLINNDANSFNIDKMVIISDDKGNGVVTIHNNEGAPLFIDASINEIEILNGTEVLRKPYNRDNIGDWKISLTNSKMVLRPGESKSVGVRSLCHNTSCDRSKDLIFMIPFIPSPYNSEEKDGSGVIINYGYSPLFIIPTDNPQYDYLIENKGEELVVYNRGNTLINVFLNACSTINSKNCQQRYTVVAGREKKYQLSQNLQSDNLSITVTSFDRSYKKEMILTKGS